jgi:hypothetical protein
LGRHWRSTSSRTSAYQNEIRIHAAGGRALERICKNGERICAGRGNERGSASIDISIRGCDRYGCAGGIGVGNSAANGDGAAPQAGSIGGNSWFGDDADGNSSGRRNFTRDVVTDNFADSLAHAGTHNSSSATRPAVSGIISKSDVSGFDAAGAIERKTRGGRRTKGRAASDPHAFAVG